MTDSLFCDCGGKYNHVDMEDNLDGTYTDSYQCDGCETWCMLTWMIGTEELTGIEYEEPGPWIKEIATQSWEFPDGSQIRPVADGPDNGETFGEPRRGPGLFCFNLKKTQILKN
jgi:hypothetical protein